MDFPTSGKLEGDRMPKQKLTIKNTTVQEWESETFMQRIDRCRAMLSLHGYLTDSENRSVRLRIQEAVAELKREQKG